MVGILSLKLVEPGKVKLSPLKPEEGKHDAFCAFYCTAHLRWEDAISRLMYLVFCTHCIDTVHNFVSSQKPILHFCEHDFWEEKGIFRKYITQLHSHLYSTSLSILDRRKEGGSSGHMTSWIPKRLLFFSPLELIYDRPVSKTLILKCFSTNNFTFCRPSDLFGQQIKIKISQFYLVLKGFSTLFYLVKKLHLGDWVPYEQAKTGLKRFFDFAKIFTKNVCPWIRGIRVKDNTDTDHHFGNCWKKT